MHLKMVLKAIKCSKGQNFPLKNQNNKEKLDFYYWFLPENSFDTYGASMFPKFTQFKRPQLFTFDFI